MIVYLLCLSLFIHHTQIHVHMPFSFQRFTFIQHATLFSFFLLFVFILDPNALYFIHKNGTDLFSCCLYLFSSFSDIYTFFLKTRTPTTWLHPYATCNFLIKCRFFFVCSCFLPVTTPTMPSFSSSFSLTHTPLRDYILSYFGRNKHT